MARCSWNPASPGQGSGFLQHKVKEVDGRVWKKTNLDLDFLIVRDGVRYGVEVKNQLGYIDQTEFQIKLAMCVHFGIRPMFVTRAMPENYIYDVMRAVSRS
jgi:predicted RecB family endonuclease